VQLHDDKLIVLEALEQESDAGLHSHASFLPRLHFKEQPAYGDRAVVACTTCLIFQQIITTLRLICSTTYGIEILTLLAFVDHAMC
jgi:hypothetical protein